ncbi:MAG TPA: acetyl-CoA carboxylase biotin carboxyl carrier protein subunit [Anaerolineae bacterium]|nr:acetyl-CoA carboxylase biotin carboxyl carrier protein subunit [Anaerolineae bacterium]
MKINIEIAGIEYEIEATRRGERLLVELAGKQYDLAVTQGQDGVLRMQNGQRQVQIVGAKQGIQRQVAVNGRTFRYTRVSDNPSGEDSAESSLSATIPAVVAEILVSIGDIVEAGDKLILLESMKMIIPIQAATAGTVSELLCSVGDSVQAGVPLITIT